MSFDVTIRGAGIFGLCIAWACTKRGAKVELVDPHGVGAGASGGIVGALAPHVPENWNPKKQFQLESLLLARGFWSEVEAVSGMSPGYAATGRVQPVADEAALALAQSRADSAADLWRGEAEWLVKRDDAGWGIDSPSGWFIQDTLSAHMHPRQACAALAAALQSRGVAVTAQASDSTAPTIWATGAAGLEDLNKGHTRLVGQGIKGQAALLDLDRAGLPQLFIDGIHIIPHLDGTTAIGSTTEREYTDPHSTDAQLDVVIAKACAAVPALRGVPVIARWAGLRPRARSRAPMLGPWPGRPGHYIANGGFKIGFGMAPKLAEVMADLVLDGYDAIPDGFEVGASL